MNKTPLTARTNRIIGGRAPSEYPRSLRDNHGVSEADERRNLESHFIDSQHLRADDFEAFFRERHRELLTRIGAVMGKQLLADPTEAPSGVVSYDELDDPRSDAPANSL